MSTRLGSRAGPAGGYVPDRSSTIPYHSRDPNVFAAGLGYAVPHMPRSVRILHLSDLHFTEDAVPLTWLSPLEADIRHADGGLGFQDLHHIVVTGDLTERALPAEFGKAFGFIELICQRFHVPRANCVVVPGNHDVYRGEKAGRDDARYPARFLNFERARRAFLDLPEVGDDELIQQLRGERYFQRRHFPSTGIEFLGLNSAWEIDEHFPDRSGINLHALAAALDEVPMDSRSMRIALWHHPLTGNEKIAHDEFCQQLQTKGFKLCLHGHVHELREDVVGYYDPGRELHVVGAGSFGATARDRPESVANLYNLLEVNATEHRVRIHTRHRPRVAGAWQGLAIWPGTAPQEKRTFHEISTAALGSLRRFGWARPLLAAALLASIAILVVRNHQLHDQLTAAGLLYPNDLFPELGPVVVVENNVDAALSWRKLGCGSACLGTATASLEISADIRREGFATLLFKKAKNQSCLDWTGRTVAIRVQPQTDPLHFEVAVRDDATTTVYFECGTQGTRAQAANFAIPIAEIPENFHEFHADRICQFSLGFSAGAGAMTGHHEMRIYGIDLTNADSPGTRCTLRTTKPSPRAQ
jgi:predicted MPP superfamily phosphohydrolase